MDACRQHVVFYILNDCDKEDYLILKDENIFLHFKYDVRLSRK